ncbi:MAG: hypothetical protein R3F11_25885 [Verrucomicrobiales bacterium]
MPDRRQVLIDADHLCTPLQQPLGVTAAAKGQIPSAAPGRYFEELAGSPPA